MESSENNSSYKYEIIAETHGLKIPDNFQNNVIQYLLDPNTYQKLEVALVHIFLQCDNIVIAEFIAALSELISETLEDFMVAEDNNEIERMTQAFMVPVYATFIRFQRTKNRLF